MNKLIDTENTEWLAHIPSPFCALSLRNTLSSICSLSYTVSDQNLWNTQLTKFTLAPYHSSSVYTWYVRYSRRLNTYLVPGTRLDTLFCLIRRTIRWGILLYCYISYYTRRKQDLQAVSWLPEAAQLAAAEPGIWLLAWLHGRWQALL